MRLLIYETTHHETLPGILDLAEIYFEKVDVFLRESTYQNLYARVLPEDKWLSASFTRQSVNESNRDFIRRAVTALKQNNYSHFHISTLDNNLLYFALSICDQKKVHISLSVQAINEYLASKYNSIRDISESFSKLYFHKRIQHYRVFFPLMKDALHKSLPSSTVEFIPSRFFQGNQSNSNVPNKFFKIIIPGSVDPIRRDYDFVLSFLKKSIFDLTKKKPVELIILGSNKTDYALKFLSELETFSSADCKIKYYQDYVQQAEYENQLAGADIIWSPVRIDTVGIRGTPEIYGESTATGLTADLLLSPMPALLPAGFKIPEHYEDAIYLYESEEKLRDLFLKFMDEKTEGTRDRISGSLSFFVKENFRSSFERLMSFDPIS